jgi:hypothetical protein
MSIKQTRMGDSDLFCRKKGGFGPNTLKAGPICGKTMKNYYEILISLTSGPSGRAV